MRAARAPLASWTFREDGRDRGPGGHHARPIGDVEFGRSTDASFRSPVVRLRGRGRLEVAAPPELHGSSLTVSAWINAAAPSTTVLGDVASWFDPQARRGFALGFEHGSPCGSHGNDRTLWFGVDSGTEPRLTDHGRPGDASVMVCSLAAFEGDLYAATWEAGPAPRGHVYRMAGDRWEDCGSPWDANAVTRLAVHDGDLYAGVSRLRGGGSGLDDSANQSPGGRVLRYEGGTRWADMGALDGADSITALVPYAGSLYAAPMYSQGLFRFDGPGTWTFCGTPGRRLLALGVHDGALYGAGNDHAQVDHAIELTRAGVVVPQRQAAGGGGVFRYEGGERWTGLGLQPDTTQLYSIETYGDAILVGTWPNGLVFRGEGLDEAAGPRWQPVGRLGRETEIMNLQAYNGKLYGGTLPHAELHRYERDDEWTHVATLDTTPDVLYRRAASMALFAGELYVGTLPSAHVWSLAAGAVATHDRSLRPGWHHVAGVVQGDHVRLFVDGRLVGSRSGEGRDRPFAPDPETPLVLGGGPRSNFEGELADVRLWDVPLQADEIAALATDEPGAGGPQSTGLSEPGR